MSPLLRIEKLQVSFHASGGVARAVRGVDLALDAGEMLALVGESGCGKSVTALSVMRLLAMPPGRFDGGRIVFKDVDLLALPEPEMRRIRGNAISMIFQEPMTSLNPIFTVGEQIAEVARLHQGKTAGEARHVALEMLRQVAIASPEQRLDQCPHELSGGMKQRVMIAMAIACRPALLIADEPTTALDVTIQAQILELLHDLQRQYGMAVLLITHNLGIVAEYARRVCVMYAGKIVEAATTVDLFARAAHPYTRGLLRSLPGGDPGKPLSSIHGAIPDAACLPAGCAFHPRCAEAMPICREREPVLENLPEGGAGHFAACWLYTSAGKDAM